MNVRHPLTSCVATLSNVFRALNAPALERVLARSFGALPPAKGAGPSGWQPFGVDGEALRGTFFDDGAAGVALVAAYLRREGRVIRLPFVRGVVLGEGACRVRSHDAPDVFAVVRNAALHLLRGAGHERIATEPRRFATSTETRRGGAA